MIKPFVTKYFIFFLFLFVGGTSSAQIEMISINGGFDTLGCTHPLNPCNYSFQQAIKIVELWDYKIGKYSVSRGEYLDIMGDNPTISDNVSYYYDPATEHELPVKEINSYSIMVFCNELSLAEGISNDELVYYKDAQLTIPWSIDDYEGEGFTPQDSFYRDITKLGYRLPTAAEWEYAARAGDDYLFSGSDTWQEVAVFLSDTFHIRGTLAPNTWGLYDMLGLTTDKIISYYDLQFPNTGCNPDASLAPTLVTNVWGDAAAVVIGGDFHSSPRQLPSFGYTNFLDVEDGFRLAQSVGSPLTCSLSSSVSTVECSDNNTPDDPTDDTYTFDIDISHYDGMASWTADDPLNSTGPYNNMPITMGPYLISDGFLSFDIKDFDSPLFVASIEVMPPEPCSVPCAITSTVSSVECNNNGTPSNPNDDTYSFDVLVTGSTSVNGWTSDEGTSGNYNETVNFGDFNIADGDQTITISDVDDPLCTFVIMVPAPQTCSDECDITATSSNILCDDNDTPCDPSDDTYSFDLEVSGLNTGVSWTSDQGASGNYNETVSFGDFNIADGDQSITISDVDDPMCTFVIMVPAPQTCSDECDITATSSNILCDDNDTPSDPSDDTYSFDIEVTGLNTGVSWTSDEGTSGNYNETVSFGDFNIADEDQSITFSDVDDPMCTYTIMVPAPETCSDLCDITATSSNILCGDNDTPSDPSDDTYSFDILVSGQNTGTSWTSDQGTNGNYNETTSFGDFNIADGDQLITISDVDDPMCTYVIMVPAPQTCSDECDITATSSNILCDDNDTPSDPSDDTYSFDIEVTGLNTGLSWTSDEGTSGNYNETVSFGEFNIADGDQSITISDVDDPMCTYVIMVPAPQTCSDECDITATTSNILCDDNDTPSDPSDDIYSFDLEVGGLNTGLSWTSDEGTSGNYNETVSFGDFNIADGDQSITISDVDNPMCTYVIMVPTPQTCSDECDITATISNILCDDNDTPSDPSDDIYSFDLLVVGANAGSEWTADGQTGNYGVENKLGTYNIADGAFTLTIIDIDDTNCQTTVDVVPPTTCSGTCSIASSLIDITCEDNGTASDPSDDIFYVELNVSGSNTAATWTDNLGNSGNYNEATIVGPFDISDGDFTLVITDADDGNCTSSLAITAPETCSDACSISATVSNVLCDDNDTPSDPSDDIFTFDVLVTGSNKGNSWSADGQTGTYDEENKLGTYNISDGAFTLTITDIDDTNCQTTVDIVPPTACSGTCSIASSLIDVSCEDNGTASDPSDDIFYVELSVSGSNTAATWTDNLGNSGNYNEATIVGPFDISDGDFTLVITDSDDSNCSSSLAITAPETCSEECDITASVSNVLCDDNDTPSDPSDDIFTFDVLVTGSNKGNSWSADGQTGTYDEENKLGTYNISDGAFTLTITDNDDANCQTTVEINPPSPCSGTCSIASSLIDISCEDNSTASDPDDDIFFVEVSVSGSNTGTNWQDNKGNNGNYNEAIILGPFDISGGDFTLIFTDSEDSNCRSELDIVAPATCSDACSISATVSNVLCDDNDTPSDPSDDIFTFDVDISGTNNGSSWSANDPLSTTDSYINSPKTFGPYLIANGNLAFNIMDVDDNSCAVDVIVKAPNTCSESCELSATVSNILCDDNDTASDPTDDTYTVNLNVQGVNTSNDWNVNDGAVSTGIYGLDAELGPFNISDGIFELIITDNEDINCQTTVDITPPSPCSGTCSISSSLINTECDDNDTPSQTDDDIFYIDININGSNTGANWIDNLGNTGSYNTNTQLGPFTITDGDFTLLFTDIDDVTCVTSLDIVAPASCSGECTIDVVSDTPICDDNDTPTDPSDDTFTVAINVTGLNVGSSWTANDANNSSGSYENATLLGPYPITPNPLTIVISDLNDANCTHELVVQPPLTCSDQCQINAAISNMLCSDNGTDTDPSDDTYTYDIIVSGNNIGTEWQTNNGASGDYNTVVSIGPIMISDGDFSLIITDIENTTCTDTIDVSPPIPCSGTCSITASHTEPICDDNGTPTLTTDDVFSFEVTVSGVNNASSWTADDINATSGSYEVSTSFGSYPISDGDLDINIRDTEDATCISNLIIIAPETCSEDCTITIETTNVQCDNNDTPSDPSDDTFSFELVATGVNTGISWTANDADNTSGLYGESVSFGPYDIDQGIVSFTIVDITNGCQSIVSVLPPSTCSDTSICSLIINSSTINSCDNNDTPDDPSDDVYSVEINVSGENNGDTYYVSSQGFVFGPFSYDQSHFVNGLPANGLDVLMEIYDSQFTDCRDSLWVSQESCSDGCPTIDIQPIVELCDNESSLDLSSLIIDAPPGNWVFVSGPENLDINNGLIDIDEKTAGIYNIIYEIIDTTIGCINQTDIELIIYNSPLNSIEGTEIICPGEEIILSSQNEYTAYKWSNDEITPSISISNSGYYQLTVIDSNDCEAISDINIGSAEEISAEDDAYSLNQNVELPIDYLENDMFEEDAEINFTIISPPTNGTLNIDDEGVLFYKSDNPEEDYTEEIVYEICLDECPDICALATITIRYIVDDRKELEMLLTPNGDGQTETLIFKTISLNLANDYPDNRLKVVNRWGDQVYQAAPYNNDWNGDDLPDGTYFFVLNLGDSKAPRKGYILLTR